MGNEIVEIENKRDCLELLAAQKQLYIISKRLFAFQIAITTVIVVVLSITNIFLDIKNTISVYSIIVAFVDIIFLRDLIENYKEKAARIQEKFDTNVLSLPRNSLIDGVDPEEIIHYANKHKRIDPLYSKLKNWYSSSITNIDSPSASIVCQRSNCVYDFRLRKNYNRVLSILIGIISTIVIAVAAFNESTIVDFLLIGVLPILPILLLFIQLHKDNKCSIANLEKLKKVANDTWAKVLANEQIDIEQTSRRLQDKIYQNRIDSPLIFEWFYNLKRNQLEEEMNYSVDRLVSDFKAART